MKRVIVLLCVLVLILAFSGISYANSISDEVPVAWKSFIRENTTGSYMRWDVPVATLAPGRVILGFVVMVIDPSKHSEALLALYDGSGGGGIASDECFDEAEADDASSKPSWYPYPRKILTQLSFHLGPNARAIIYWE